MKRWVQVDAPKPWRPKPGEELIGIYAGTQQKDGVHGRYNVHFVRPDEGVTQFVSGARVDQLFMSVAPGSRVRVVFCGREEFQAGQGEIREAKEFELYTEVTEVRA